MATVTALTAANMANAQVFLGTITGLTPTSITVTNGSMTSVYLGNFAYDNAGVHGTLTGYQFYIGTTLQFTASGLAVDAFTVMNLLTAGLAQDIYEIALNGNDTINGSAFGDLLLAFGGDDILRGGGGHDTLDGGTGSNGARYVQHSKNFTVTVSGDAVVVQDRAGLEGTDTLLNINHIQFGEGGAFDPTWMIKASRLGQAQFGDLIELYIAYFDRAPDALGLEYWASRVVDGMSIDQIAKSFFVQPETLAAYPPSMSTPDFVTKVYNNVLGRAPDAGGLAYWVNDLNSGAQTRDKFVLSVIYGARAATGSPVDAQYLANKEAVGGRFALEKGLNDVNWAKQVMDKVDATLASVSAANQMIDSFAQAAVTTDPHLLLPLVGVAH